MGDGLVEQIESGVGLDPDIETVYIGSSSADSRAQMRAELVVGRSTVLNKALQSSAARLLGSSDDQEEIGNNLYSLYKFYGELSAETLIAAFDGDPETFRCFLAAQGLASLDTKDLNIKRKYDSYYDKEIVAKPDVFAEILLGIRPQPLVAHESFQHIALWMMEHEARADLLLSDPHARPESIAIFTQMRNVTRALTKEAVTMIAKAETAEERLDLMTLYYRSLSGFQTISEYTEAIEKGEDIKIPETDYDELDWMNRTFFAFPEATLAREIGIQEWMFRMAQKQLSEFKIIKNPDEKAQRKVDFVQARREWVKNFYARVVAMDVYHEKAGAYTDTKERDVQKLYTTIVDLVDRGELPRNFNMTSVGCGDGLRVESAVLQMLKEKGEQYVPSHITGIDFMKQTSEISGMSFVQADILDIPEKHPELLGQADFVIAFGSPFNNMDALPEQIRYLQIVRQLLREERGIFIHDTGSFDPVPKQNTRTRAAEEFFRKFHKEIGAVGVNPAYKIETDKPDETGAFLYLHELYVALSHLSGFKVLSPSDDPVTYAKQKERVQTLKDFIASTKEGKSAVEDPYYCANPPEENTENLESLPVNGRVLYVSRAISASEMTDVASHLSRQASRIVV